MVGEGEREPEDGGGLGAVVARAEQPDLGFEVLARDRRYAPGRVLLAEAALEEPDHLLELTGEVLGAERVGGAPQGGGGHRVGAGGATDAEIDPPRVERLEHPELLGDDQRRVVGEHDPAGADPDLLGRVGERHHQHRRRGAGDAGHVVMLGDPVAAVAEPLDVLGELDRVA